MTELQQQANHESVCSNEQDTPSQTEELPNAEIHFHIGERVEEQPSTSSYGNIYMEMDNLRNERDQLLKENAELKLLVQSTGLRYAAAMESEDKCLLLTGLKPNVLTCLVEYLVKDRSKVKPTRLSFEDQIVLTIIKLKHDLVFDLLAAIYGISSTTAIEYFWCWIDIMHAKLKRLVRMQDIDHIYRTIYHPILNRSFLG